MSGSISTLLCPDHPGAGSSPMSTRSRLRRDVLQAWDQSVEGALYLHWLADADPRLDGGLVLREAVLEWTEPGEPASAPADKALAEFCARLSPGRAGAVREKAVEVAVARSQIAKAIRQSAGFLRKYREKTGWREAGGAESVGDRVTARRR